mmetsp:Transcript_44875/g.108461  ORF Transcript_44875/g.108461 Transcript_44875/m.108461 type:complete len:134 (-) Transcript_44875:103-504(-)
MLKNRSQYSKLQKGEKSSRLTSERLVQLTEIGFQFKRRPNSNPVAIWNQRVQELKNFYEKHGHFKVPNNTEAYKSLYNWLQKNQSEYNNNIQKGMKSSRLTDQRIGQLESICFHFADTGKRGQLQYGISGYKS